MILTYDAIASRIDHSLLGPTLSTKDLEAGCRLALEYKTASVCIKPYAVKLACRILDGSQVAVGTTIGFPHGGHASRVKVLESQAACDDGARELDMVVNIGQVLSGEWNAVKDDIAGVTELAHSQGALVKVIFENCYLSNDQKRKLCEICGELRVDFVKTSTGYGTGGATHEDLKLMRLASPSWVKLKAAGGVRDLDSLLAVVELGCDRVGASKTAEILDELKSRLSGQAPNKAAESGTEAPGY